MESAKGIHISMDRRVTPQCGHCTTRGRCLFSTLSREEHEGFWARVRERSVPAGEFIETQGQRPTQFGVVKVGLLKGMRSGVGGIEKPIVILGKGRVVGFSQPFGLASTLSLVTMTPSRVCEIDVHAISDLAMVHLHFNYALYQKIADFTNCIADWSLLLRQDDYLFKVCVALHLIAAEEGSQSFRIPSHTELASVLGIRRETVVRQIALLIDQGLFKKVDRWHGELSKLECAVAPMRS